MKNDTQAGMEGGRQGAAAASGRDLGTGVVAAKERRGSPGCLLHVAQVSSSNALAPALYL